MEAKDFRIRKTLCSSPLPDIKVPMVNTMVACLRVEHRKLNDLNTQLAYGATRLASDPGASDWANASSVCAKAVRDPGVCSRSTPGDSSGNVAISLRISRRSFFRVSSGSPEIA
jgi:hypothetical protein